MDRLISEDYHYTKGHVHESLLGWVPKYSDIETVIETAWKWHENKRF